MRRSLPARPSDAFTALDPLVDRAAHAASLLPDGRVLITGGCNVDGCGEATASTEISDTPPTKLARWRAAAVEHGLELVGPPLPE